MYDPSSDTRRLGTDESTQLCTHACKLSYLMHTGAHVYVSIATKQLIL